mgnify:CR=1 FL=1
MGKVILKLDNVSYRYDDAEVVTDQFTASQIQNGRV